MVSARNMMERIALGNARPSYGMKDVSKRVDPSYGQGSRKVWVLFNTYQP